MDMMPGDREAAGAIEGMAEVYGRPKVIWFSDSLDEAPNLRGVIVEQHGDRVAIRDEDGVLHLVTRAHLSPF
jgi:hypothetical protein